jgi:DeoR family glycerol-3-phosphate regulon repressor
MLSLEPRSQAILEKVRTEGFQPIETLAALFGVTSQTIRRDVNALCEEGLLLRRHGGVDVPPRANPNLLYEDRQILNLDAKRRIAAQVASAIPDGASLFLGIGTTPEQVAHALTGRTGLTVMTNNLNVAMVLARSGSASVSIASGTIRPHDLDVVGPEAAQFFDKFKVDIAIFGVGGVDADGSLLDFSTEEVQTRLRMRANCRRSFLVLDHSKFGRNASVRGGHIADVSAVFTDAPPPPAIASLLAASDVTLTLAP